MKNDQDPRIAELEALAREEQIELPCAPAIIIWLEDKGYVVDLVNGVVYRAVTATPTGPAKAVNYLLPSAA